MGVYIDTIKKYSKAKIVLRAHNVEHFIWDRHIAHEKSGLMRWYLSLQNNRLKRFELKVISQVDAIVPITTTDEKAFVSLGSVKPIYSCITGVDVKTYQTKLNQDEKAKTIFYFGSMDWLPNQDAVVWFLENCWDTVHRAVPEARLIIAGRGMPLEFFHITKPNVVIVENIPNGKQFYQQHQVMIVPLWSGSGLRIKIIEGMSYGKAIVSTRIGAEGINYKDGENILIADTPANFSKSVIELLTDDNKRKMLEKNAATFSAKEFDNSHVVAGLIRFYKQLIDG
jgi:glycosyltransferase involved in cell wall biosynthesis